MSVKPLFAFKHGDVARGNWSWAVGADGGYRPPLHLASLNFHGCIAAGYDPEKLAPVMAEAPAMLEVLRALTGFAPTQSAEWFRNSLHGQHLADEAEQWERARTILARIDGEAQA